MSMRTGLCIGWDFSDAYWVFSGRVDGFSHISAETILSVLSCKRAASRLVGQDSAIDRASRYNLQHRR